jgi:hypothetical protein
MATMGQYCKAYLLSDLKKFPGWPETLTNLRPASEEDEAEPAAAASGPRVLTDDDYFFVQESFQVTDGIFVDEHVVFADVTPEWKRFCTEELKFEVPVFDPIEIDEAPAAQAAATATASTR